MLLVGPENTVRWRVVALSHHAYRIITRIHVLFNKHEENMLLLGFGLARVASQQFMFTENDLFVYFVLHLYYCLASSYVFNIFGT